MSVVDMRIDIDDSYCYSPKFLGTPLPRRSVSLPVISGRSRRRGVFFYAKLPEEPLKLSILKLDGSCFEIQIMKTATVSELRLAVEDAFSYMPSKGPGKISWPHVWSHFCLTYDGRKLVIETNHIRNYGIRDGDQLQFIRHISNSFSLKKNKKRRSIKRVAALEHYEMSPSTPDIYEESRKEDNFWDVENGLHHHYDEIDNSFDKKETRLATFFHFHRWLCYSRMATMERSLNGYSTKSAFSILGSFRKVIELCNDTHYYQKAGCH